LDDADAPFAEQTAPFPAPFPIAVTDQDAIGPQQPGIRRRERATDLPHEEIAGMWGRANDLHATRGQVDHEQRVGGHPASPRPHLGSDERAGLSRASAIMRA